MIKDKFVFFYILGIFFLGLTAYIYYVEGDYKLGMLQTFFLGTTLMNFINYLTIKKDRIIIDREFTKAIKQFEVIKDRYKTQEPPHITCPKCKKTSYSQGDIDNKFCIQCGYHSDL